MALTRLKNNQYTDANIAEVGFDTNVVSGITNVKIAYQTITGDKWAQNVDANANLILRGNLTVVGEVTAVESVVSRVTDPVIELGTGNDGSTYDLGLMLIRGNIGDNAAMIYDESEDQFAFVYTTDDASTSNVITINNYGTIRAFSANLDEFNVGNIRIANSTITTDGTSVDLIVRNADVEGNIVVGLTGDNGNVIVNDYTYLNANVDTLANVNAYGEVYANANVFSQANLTVNAYVITQDLQVNANANVGDTLTTNNLTVNNNLSVGGNLVVMGNTTYLNVETVAAEDSIMDLNGNVDANGVVTMTTSVDVGIHGYSDSTATGNVFFGYDYSTNHFAYYTDATVTNGVVAGNLGGLEGSAVIISGTDGAGNPVESTFGTNVSIAGNLITVDTQTSNVSAWTGNVLSLDTTTGAIVVEGVGGVGIGGNLNVGALANLGNVQISEATITTRQDNLDLNIEPNGTGNIIVNGTNGTGTFTINGNVGGNAHANTFVVQGNAAIMVANTDANLNFVDGITMNFRSTGAIILPHGGNAERNALDTAGSPGDYVGAIRYNTEDETIEWWNGLEWAVPRPDFTVVTSQTVNGNGTDDTFALTDPNVTTIGAFVTINGVLQQPGDAYTVATGNSAANIGSNITFTEIPSSSDVISVRQITTTKTVGGLGTAATGINLINNQLVFTSGGTEIFRANGAGITLVGNALLYGTATQAQYADLAEKYTADAEYAPGTVLDFGGEAEVTLSSTDGSRKIAGVVTTNPAYLMNSALEGVTAAIALQGRVPCKVTGVIQKGDMLVSNGDGTARAEADPKLGSVIGKALTSHGGGLGIIEVVVGRD